MPILVHPSRGVANFEESTIDDWADPLWRIYTEEINSLIKSLTEPNETISNEDSYFLCERLCEASRSLLYKTDFISVLGASELSKLFARATETVTLIAATHTSNENRKNQILGYANHIQARSKLLLEKIELANAG